MFASGFDVSFPAVDRFYRGDLDVDAGGEVFLEEGAGDFAGFGEGGAGNEDEAELSGGHGFLGRYCNGFAERRKLSAETQRAQRRRERRRRGFVRLDRRSPSFAKGAKDGAPGGSG